jgi:carotenoid 1,2-hydratase
MNLLSGVGQDFHRPQKSPGGYEWWHFDGTDDRTGYSFSIQFHAGNLFSAYYQDSLKTYWQKTKSPLVDGSSNLKIQAPNPPGANPPALSLPNGPNPLDYCGVTFRLFRKGSLVAESLQEFSPKSLKASDKQSAVLLGPNRFNWDDRGDPPSYVLTVQAPLQGGKTTLRSRLFFTPLLKGIPTLPQAEIPFTHTWVLAAPLCHVEGTLQWVNAKGESQKEEGFVGKGYHDHHFGSVPLDRFVKAWHWGRAFLGDETLVYSVQVPTGKGEPAQGFLLALGPSGSEAWQVAFQLSKNRRNFFWLPYQKNLEFTDAQSLRIDHHQILGDGPASLVFEDRVRWISGGKTTKGTGLSNYLYAPRLSSRFFFPMLKGKTTIVSRAQEPGDLPPPSGDVSTTRPAL